MSWTPNPLEEQRLDKLAQLEEENIDPYPLRAHRTHLMQEAISLFEASTDGDELVVTVCGRVKSIRDMGKTLFAHIEDESGSIQLFIRREEGFEVEHKRMRKLIDLGDFLQVSGILFRTRMGEISIRVPGNGWSLLSKSLTPLPVGKEQEIDGEIVRYSAFSDVEERYRRRYADLAVHPEVRDIFRTRAKLIRSLRSFLDEHQFLEVETPILQPLYGGAAARPFVTHHNQLHQDLYLRVSFELYLKRLLVGGFERVYEIGRDFRNEGVSFKHNPEFTQLEFYAAYWDYHDVMDFTEQMLAYVAEQLLGATEFVYQEHTINLAPGWSRISLRDAIKKYASLDYVDYPDAVSLGKAIREIGGHAPAGASWGKLIDGLLGDYVEPHLIQPTFITEYPRDISPLAKGIPEDPQHVERFEFFIAGMEMGNAFTELNDPIDQRKRFEDMQKMYQSTDDEMNPLDEDYLRAMRYGMPPNGGFGTGIDRLTMLFTNKATIREVLLFPHLRERSE